MPAGENTAPTGNSSHSKTSLFMIGLRKVSVNEIRCNKRRILLFSLSRGVSDLEGRRDRSAQVKEVLGTKRGQGQQDSPSLDGREQMGSSL